MRDYEHAISNTNSITNTEGEMMMMIITISSALYIHDAIIIYVQLLHIY